MIVCKIKLNARKDEVVESVTDPYWRETNVQRFNWDSTQRSSRQLERETFNLRAKGDLWLDWDHPKDNEGK